MIRMQLCKKHAYYPYRKHVGSDVAPRHSGYVTCMNKIPPLSGVTCVTKKSPFSSITLWLKCEVFQYLKRGQEHFKAIFLVKKNCDTFLIFVKSQWQYCMSCTSSHKWTTKLQGCEVTLWA